MGVAIDYYVHITQVRGHIFLVVDQEEAYAFDGKGAVEREFLCPFFIVVAPDDIKGTKACQSVYNGLGVNVPAVDDNVSSTWGRRRPWVSERMAAYFMGDSPFRAGYKKYHTIKISCRQEIAGGK